MGYNYLYLDIRFLEAWFFDEGSGSIEEVCERLGHSKKFAGNVRRGISPIFNKLKKNRKKLEAHLSGANQLNACAREKFCSRLKLCPRYKNRLDRVPELLLPPSPELWLRSKGSALSVSGCPIRTIDEFPLGEAFILDLSGTFPASLFRQNDVYVQRLKCVDQLMTVGAMAGTQPTQPNEFLLGHDPEGTRLLCHRIREAILKVTNIEEESVMNADSEGFAIPYLLETPAQLRGQDGKMRARTELDKQDFHCDYSADALQYMKRKTGYYPWNAAIAVGKKTKGLRLSLAKLRERKLRELSEEERKSDFVLNAGKLDEDDTIVYYDEVRVGAPIGSILLWRGDVIHAGGHLGLGGNDDTAPRVHLYLPLNEHRSGAANPDERKIIHRTIGKEHHSNIARTETGEPWLTGAGKGHISQGRQASRPVLKESLGL